MKYVKAKALLASLALSLLGCGGGGGSSTGSEPVQPPGRSPLEILAGAPGGEGNIDGPPGVARFETPRYVAADRAGNLYVVDSFNGTIRKIDAGGNVTTLFRVQGQAGLGAIQDIAADAGGNVFYIDGNQIRKVTPAGAISTLAGDPAPGTVDGTGSVARFSRPTRIVASGSGALYVLDNNGTRVRRVASDGVVTTLAGAAEQRGGEDGVGADARFANPMDLAVTLAGDVLVVDNHTVRKVTQSGVVTTIAGTAGAARNQDGPAAEATFRTPYAIGVDDGDNAYVLEFSGLPLGDTDIRKLSNAGIVTTFAQALGHDIPDLAVSASGAVYTLDLNRRVVARVQDATAIVFAGLPAAPGNTDGPGIVARFGGITDMATDRSGNVYVADGSNGVRKVARDAQVTTVVPASSLSGGIVGVATDDAGNLYVGVGTCEALRGALPFCHGAIYRKPPDGNATPVVITGSSDASGTDIRLPTGLAVDSATGNIYVGDNDDSSIRRITPAGDVTRLARLGVQDLALGRSGNLYATDGPRVTKVTPSGAVSTLAGGLQGYADGAGTTARFNITRGIAVDEQDNVYVADEGNNAIRKITPDGVVSTVAGTAGMRGFVPGPLPGVLDAPVSVALDGSDLYIAMHLAIAVAHDRP